MRSYKTDINSFPVALSIISFLVITITCLVIAEPKQPSPSVWQGFENDTGWGSNGVVFFMGLISVNYGFAGLDGAVHLATVQMLQAQFH